MRASERRKLKELADGLALAIPCVDDAPLFVREDAPNRLRRLITHPLEFRRLHGSHKLKRSEARRMRPIQLRRRVRLWKLGAALLKFYDLPSGRCGCPRSDSFLETDGSLGYGPNKSTKYVCAPGHEGDAGLAATAGLSLTELRRSITDYRAAEWLTSTQRVVAYTNAAGELAYYSCRVVYVLTAKFFEDLRIDHKWHRARRAASERAGHRTRIYPLRAPVGKSHRHHVDGDPRAAERQRRRQARDLRHDAIAVQENERRAELARQLELRRLHPDWPAERVRAEAKHQT